MTAAFLAVTRWSSPNSLVFLIITVAGGIVADKNGIVLFPMLPGGGFRVLVLVYFLRWFPSGTHSQ